MNLPNVIDEDFNGTGDPLGFGGSFIQFYHSTAKFGGQKSMFVDATGNHFAVINVHNTGFEIDIDVLLDRSGMSVGPLIKLFGDDNDLAVGLLIVSVNLDGNIQIDSGGHTAKSVGVFTDNTPWYLRVHYKAKTLNHDAECEVFFSLTPTMPARGNANYAGILNGTKTRMPLQVRLYSDTESVYYKYVKITSIDKFRNVIILGDSISNGFGTIPDGIHLDCWPIRMQERLGLNRRVINLSYNGARLDDIITAFPDLVARLAPVLNRNGPAIVCFWELINLGMSGSDIYDLYVTMSALIIGAGMIPVLSSDFHNFATSGTIGNGVQDAGNLIRANFPTLVGPSGAFVELNLPELVNDTLSNPDIHTPGPGGLHLTTWGWNRIDPLWTSAVLVALGEITIPVIDNLHPSVGQTINCSIGVFPNNGEITQQWFIDGVAKVGAVGTSYLVVSGDAHKIIHVQQYSTMYGKTLTVNSKPTFGVSP